MKTKVTRDKLIGFVAHRSDTNQFLTRKLGWDVESDAAWVFDNEDHARRTANVISLEQGGLAISIGKLTKTVTMETV